MGWGSFSGVFGRWGHKAFDGTLWRVGGDGSIRLYDVSYIKLLLNISAIRFRFLPELFGDFLT